VVAQGGLYHLCSFDESGAFITLVSANYLASFDTRFLDTSVLFSAFCALNDLDIFGSSFDFVTFGFLSISLISPSLLVLSIGLASLHTEVRFWATINL